MKEVRIGCSGWSYERIEPLREAGKLGPVLWQLPENFHRDEETLAAALAALPPADHCAGRRVVLVFFG